MKKALLSTLVIAIIIVSAFSFTACNNATVQGQLENVWRPYERYTYDVSTEDGTTGTYVTTIKKYLAGESIADFGGASLTNLKSGYLITGELSLGSTSYVLKNYFNLIDGSNYLIPSASYRKQVTDGTVTLEINGVYSGSTYNYSGSIDGAAASGSIGLSSPYYDNNEFHQVLRGASSMSTSFSFTFNTPVVYADEAASISLTAACSTLSDVSVPYGDITCYMVKISRSTKVAGAHQELYYSANALRVDSNGDNVIDDKDWSVTRALVKIVESVNDDGTKCGGWVEYNLSSVSLTEPEE